ncbi:Txe/YoeB family addiction module toxin [Halomonas sp. BC04]|uniref:Txe/YoeB family addiction module toxin n=1 Tax=Halomonas sp. BC04 TaxID=1403540 RepID=UPI0003ED5CBB|nr:Txe/YoeB family addiction module toxin [Halomonas sp. BC04]EWH02995.1 Txe/YoeB family addiction module toxin [Halomonas sp. BC04]
MRSLVFEGNTWEAYEAMHEKDKRLHKALCKLLREMLRSDDPSSGLGKPEPLKHNLAGLWSRRISQKDRLIYRFDDASIYIFAIGGHYDQPDKEGLVHPEFKYQAAAQWGNGCLHTSR